MRCKMNLNAAYSNKLQKAKAVLLCTLIWGFVAHGFAFANLNLSHDSLYEFSYYDSWEWKIELGRFSEPAIRLLMGEVYTFPWLTGIVSLLFIAGAVFLTLEIFELSSLFEIILLSGIYTTNVTVFSCVATYAHDLAGDMAALLLAVCSVYLWKKSCVSFSWGLFFGAIACTAVSTGFYQSYFSVSIVLIMIYSIMGLLRQEKFSDVFRRGIYAIVVLSLGFVLYLILVKLVCLATGIALDDNDYNSLATLWSGSHSIVRKIAAAYLHVVWAFSAPTYAANSVANISDFFRLTLGRGWMYAAVLANVTVILLAVFAFIRLWLAARPGKTESLLIVFLLILMPIAMDLATITSDASHALMHFSYWLLYLFAGLLIKELRNSAEGGKLGGKRCVGFASAAVLILLAGNVETSNALYVKKELEGKATLSTMTRVVSRIEEQESYEYGQTPVAFVGLISTHKGLPGTDAVSEVIGAKWEYEITYQKVYQRYFNNVLQYDIRVCSEEQTEALHSLAKVQQMPLFPAKGSVQEVDGVIVVKLGE